MNGYEIREYFAEHPERFIIPAKTIPPIFESDSPEGTVVSDQERLEVMAGIIEREALQYIKSIETLTGERAVMMIEEFCRIKEISRFKAGNITMTLKFIMSEYDKGNREAFEVFETLMP